MTDYTILGIIYDEDGFSGSTVVKRNNPPTIEEAVEILTREKFPLTVPWDEIFIIQGVIVNFELLEVRE